MAENAIKPDGAPAPYEDDFVAWTEVQAAALRAGPSALARRDWANLAEEIADLGSEQIDAMESFARLIFEHLLYQAHGDAVNARHWKVEILEFRGSLADKLRRNPGQRQRVDLQKCWRRATQKAALKLARSDIAARGKAPPPLTLEQLEDEDGDIDDLIARI